VIPTHQKAPAYSVGVVNFSLRELVNFSIDDHIAGAEPLALAEQGHESLASARLGRGGSLLSLLGPGSPSAVTRLHRNRTICLLYNRTFGGPYRLTMSGYIAEWRGVSHSCPIG
jgi:hypothetical protein